MRSYWNTHRLLQGCNRIPIRSRHKIHVRTPNIAFWTPNGIGVIRIRKHNLKVCRSIAFSKVIKNCRFWTISCYISTILFVYKKILWSTQCDSILLHIIKEIPAPITEPMVTVTKPKTTPYRKPAISISGDVPIGIGKDAIRYIFQS
jgi:hypothetical protein